jgi:hypothetical protein
MWDQVNEALRQSASRLLTGVASVLPGVVAMLVAVLIAALIGWVLRVLLLRMLRGTRFDERMEHLASPRSTPPGRRSCWARCSRTCLTLPSPSCCCSSAR